MLNPTSITRQGNKLLIRAYDVDSGERKNMLTSFKPHLYERAPFGTTPELADALSLRGENHPLQDRIPLNRIEFDNIWDFTQHVYEKRDIPGFEMFGLSDVVGQAYSRLFPQKIEHNFDHISTFNVDIEVMSSFLDNDGNVVRGPFPEPIIEPEEYRKKSFCMNSYTNHISKFYQWWATEFPKSKIPIILDCDAAFPVTMIQLSDWKTGKLMVWALPLSKDAGKYRYNNDDEMIGGLSERLVYEEFDNEQDLLKAFIRYWVANTPDCLTGWNVKHFDVGYICSRVLKILGEDWMNSLSPAGMVKKFLVRPESGIPYHSYEIKGVAVLDYILLYKKHRLVERKSYTLDYICKTEIDEEKIKYSGDLNTVYLTDYETYVRYGIKDPLLVDGLDAKLSFINLSWALQASYKCDVEATVETVKPWRYLMFDHNFNKGDKPLVPQIKRKMDSVHFEGAFVHSPIVGRHQLIVAEDLKSLYPHIQQQWNMGPETIVTEEHRSNIIFELIEEIKAIEVEWLQEPAKEALLKALSDDEEVVEQLIQWSVVDLPDTFETLVRHNVSMAGNLQFFHNDEESCYSSISKVIYSERSNHKKRMYKHEQAKLDAKEANQMEIYHKEDNLEATQGTFQMGRKIQLNSGYGAIGNSSFVEYFDPLIARAITAGGMLINKYTTEFINKKLSEIYGEKKKFIVYGDTDSVYICLDSLRDKIGITEEMTRDEQINIVDKFEKEVLSPFIKTVCERMCKLVNGREQRMFWEREVICLDGGIFQAKKKYALLADDNEGVRYPSAKLKVTGLASKVSKTPDLVVPWLEESYKKAIRGEFDELRAYIKERKAEYKQLPVSDIAGSSSVKEIHKWVINVDDLLVKSGTPYHVRASILHNNLVSKMEGSNLSFIDEGDKIKIINIVPNNPFSADGKFKYLAFLEEWPQEFEQYRNLIDYNKLFTTVFEDQVQLFLDAVDETTKKKVALW